MILWTVKPCRKRSMGAANGMLGSAKEFRGIQKCLEYGKCFSWELM